MEPVEEFVRVRVPDRTVELRVHGVSGTPPEVMLGGFPVRVAGDADAGFYRVHDAGAVGGVLEAFSWGGLTSRRRITALWLFLAPLSLINVAGWMSPEPSAVGETSDKDRGGAARIRAAAMTLVALVATALVATVAVQAAASVLGMVGMVDMGAPSPTGGEVALVLLAAGAVPLGLHVLAKLGGMPDDRARHDDPWGRLHAYRALAATHLGAGLAVVALVGSAATGQWARWGAWDIAAAAVAASVLLAAAVLVVRVRTAGPDAPDSLARAMPAAGCAAWAIAVVAAVMGDGGVDAAGGLTAAHVVLAGVTVVLLATAWMAESRMPVQSSAGYSVAVAAVGFLMAYSALGALSYALFAWASDEPVGRFVAHPQPSAMFHIVDVAAVVLTCGGLFLAGRLVGIARPLAPRGDHGFDAAVRMRHAVAAIPEQARVTGLGMLIASGVCIVAVVVREVWGASAWADALVTFLTEPRVSIGAVGWVFAAFAAVQLCRGRAAAGWSVAGGVAAIAGLGWVLGHGGVDVWAWARPLDGMAAADASEPWVAATAFTLISVVVALLIPAATVLWFVFSASGTRQSRRGVGTLWDLTNFWPRLHHPWAPPPYSERAIPALEARLRTLTGEYPSHTVVLSCHSQGAVLGVPVMRRLAADGRLDADGGTVAILTYGALMGEHYRALFPRLFDAASVAALAERLPRRWIHLFRETDPLGHPVPELGPDNWAASHAPVADARSVLTHSSYGYSPEYQAALDALARRGRRDAG